MRINAINVDGVSYDIGGSSADLSSVVLCLNDIKAILSKAVFTEDISSLMSQFQTHIDEIIEYPDIEQFGSLLRIRRGVSASQSGSTLNIT